jgi:hypothetical protein
MNIILLPYQKPAVAGGASAAFGTPFTMAADTTAMPIKVATAPWTNGIGGLCKEGFQPKQRRGVQAVEYFRGLFKGNIARGQFENSLKFTVQRTFDDLDLCLAFLAVHADTVPDEGCLQVTLTGVGTRFLPNAQVQDVECVKHIGASCDMMYSLVGSYDPVRGTGGPWQQTKA